MCRYLPSSAVNRPVGLGVYTKAMMNNRILTICAAIAAGMAGTSLAQAQQGYPAPPGQVYSTAPGPYVPVAMRLMNAAAPANPISTHWTTMTRRRTARTRLRCRRLAR